MNYNINDILDVLSESTSDSLYNIYPEIFTESKSRKLYFLSDKNMDGQILHPRIPKNYFTKNDMEDDTIPRVCFAPDIKYCLRALSAGLQGKELFVHVPINEFKMHIPTTKEVPDANITKEIWALEPVTIKMIGKIKVGRDYGPDLKFTAGDKTYYDCDFKYKWVSKEKNITESVKKDTNIKPISNKPLTTKEDKKKHKDGTEEIKITFFDNDEEIGHASVCETADDHGTMFLYNVEVKSSLRGCGYGTKIVKYMIDKYNVKHLNVAKDNKIAINLYKKFNFKINGNVRMGREIMYRMTRS